MTECDYGCSQLDVEEVCTICGHKKKYHSTVHPHICMGTIKEGQQSPTESCGCNGFKKKEN